ncbi:tetratricopeptide repeat (TPR)-like superfamily protein [Tasmannia lanceolata]|uniref:tetratricopeptide repeat (TPR)-like superfamily protein n=1 Tax=Tasmannia lanceolata TaxID=3420 RepID=UPI0040629269
MVHSFLLRATSKIVALSKSGMIETARKVFDEMPQRDLIAWNAMLSSYSQLGLPQEALLLFSHMRNAGVEPDAFSFTAALSTSAEAGELKLGSKFHALVICFGLQYSLPVCNSLIDMYGKCFSPCNAYRMFEDMSIQNEVSWCSLLFAYTKSGRFENARQLFDEMPHRSEVAWNILIAGYTRYGEAEFSIDLFKQMQINSFRGDLWTFTCLMNACAELSEPCYGCMIHACIAKSGWSSAVEASNSILSFYAKLGCHDDAIKIFESIKIPTLVSLNALIDAHMKIGNVNEALHVFRRAPEHNIVSWTAMICGYARNGHGEQALCFFVDMVRGLLLPDDFTFRAVLQACANLSVLAHGRMVHGCIIRYGFQSYNYVSNALVNMYAKCGDIEGSKGAFDGILYKDLVSWNAMLFGFGLHGQAQEALSSYEAMVASGIRPDKVSFIGLLMGCSHSGLIERGQELFDSMESVYGLEPDSNHVGCLIDMLGRGGYMREASNLVESCSKMVNLRTSSCEALLGACAVNGDVELGRKVGDELMNMEPLKEMGYVLLSNLYCGSGQWKEAERVRKAMAEHGVKKMPGYSWIQVRNMVMIFVAGDLSNPLMEYICKIIELLESEMRNPSFIGFPMDL